MSKIIGVDPDRVFGLQEDYGKKAHIAMNNNDEQFFDCLEAFLKANYQQKETFIEEVLERKSLAISFVVGKAFGPNSVEGLIPRSLESNFKIWLWKPAQTKMVSVNALGKNYLKEYVLPGNINDTMIQRNTNSIPMEEDQFWAMLYLFMVNPKLGKKILKYELRKDKEYIFHVKLASGKVVTVNVDFQDKNWNLKAYVFGDKYWYFRDHYVFFFLSTIEN